MKSKEAFGGGACGSADLGRLRHNCTECGGNKGIADAFAENHGNSGKHGSGNDDGNGYVHGRGNRGNYHSR